MAAGQSYPRSEVRPTEISRLRPKQPSMRTTMGLSLKSPPGIGLVSAGVTLVICLGVGIILIEHLQREASEQRALEIETLQAQASEEFRKLADRLLITVESTDRKITEAMQATEDNLFMSADEQQTFEEERIEALAAAVTNRLATAAANGRNLVRGQPGGQSCVRTHQPHPQ